MHTGIYISVWWLDVLQSKCSGSCCFCCVFLQPCMIRMLHERPAPLSQTCLPQTRCRPRERSHRPVTRQYKIIVIRTRDWLDCDYSHVFTQVWECVFMLIYCCRAFSPHPKTKLPKSQQRFCHLEASRAHDSILLHLCLLRKTSDYLKIENKSRGFALSALT